MGGPGERLDVERLAVAGVDEVFRAQEVADRMDGRDPTSIASTAGPGLLPAEESRSLAGLRRGGRRIITAED